MFFRCPDCRKLHTATFIGPMTVCACGRELWSIALPLWRTNCRDF